MMHTDTPAEKDELGREFFANQIADNIIQSFPNGTDSIVLGLNGRWGSGKSTLMRFIIKRLKMGQSQYPIIIYDEFNPWMFSGQEDLQKTFLSELKNKLHTPNYGEKAISKLNEYWGKLPEAAREFLPGGTAQQNLIEAIFKTAPAQLKTKVDELLSNTHIKLAIFLDDLDRLSPDEILQIFQLVKLNANFKNTFFVIAYDKEVVLMALRKQFGDMAEKYLSKIVQIDYAVPELTRLQIDTIFHQKLNTFLEDCAIPYKSENFKIVWQQTGLRHFFPTLRDIYRYMTALRFRLPSIKNDVDIEQFLILEAIRIFDTEAYQKIYDLCQEGITLMGVVTPHRNGKDDFWHLNESDLRPLIPYDDEKKSQKQFKTNTSRLIEYLFPNSKTTTFAKLDKKIYNRLAFETYFSLTVTSENVAAQELEDFLTNPSCRAGVLEQIISTHRLDIFFEYLQNSELLKQHTINESGLFSTFLDVREFAVENEYVEIYSEQLLNSILSLINHFPNPNQGFKSLIRTLANKGTYTFYGAKVFILNYLYRRIKATDFRYREQVVEHQAQIVAALQQHLDLNWIFDNYTSHCRFIKTMGIQCLKHISPDIYLNQLNKMLNEPEKWQQQFILVLEAMFMRSYNLYQSQNLKERFNGLDEIYPETKQLLLPTLEHEKKFFEILAMIPTDSLSEFDKNMITRAIYN